MNNMSIDVKYTYSKQGAFIRIKVSIKTNDKKYTHYIDKLVGYNTDKNLKRIVERDGKYNTLIKDDYIIIEKISQNSSKVIVNRYIGK